MRTLAAVPTVPFLVCLGVAGLPEEWPGSMWVAYPALYWSQPGRHGADDGELARE